MSNRDIFVIGASSGGFDVLKQLVGGLPADFPAAIFVVWHMAPDARGVLPLILNKSGALPATNAVDGEAIRPGKIYIAPPDHHLIVEKTRVRVTRGPKENRFRPAVDPLFRSAAYAHRERVVGVILTGALDDGTAGLWTVKEHGGIAVVQDPQDAAYPSMPENALREVRVDYTVPAREMPDLLVRLSREKAADAPENAMPNNEKRTALEIGIAAENSALESGIMQHGELTPYTCPECRGVLLELRDGNIKRFRCHTGHAFSADSLLTSISENIEEELWKSLRAIEESIMLLDHLGKHMEADDQPLANLYFRKARAAEQRARSLRVVVMQNEQLSIDNLRDQSGEQPS